MSENAQITAITVRNDLPVEIICITPESIAQVSALVEASNMTVNDAPSLDNANGLYRKIDALAKAISSNRLEITRPIDALKKKIIEAEEAATQPLLVAKKSLSEKMVGCQRELERVRLEAEKKAREEAELKAREERARLEAERQKIIDEQKRLADEAKKKAEEEALLFGTEPEAIIEPPPPPPPPVVVVAVVDRSSIPEVTKTVVTTKTRQKLVIFDEALIPLALAGVILRVPDTKAIEKLLKAGVPVPGARLESVESIGGIGGRR